MNARGEKFTQACRGMRAVWPCGADGSRASLKFGVQGHDHGFVLFLFATTGFHIARSGIFWTPTFVL